MKKNGNIYTKQCTELVDLFNHAKDPKKVLCIPIDYAKNKHVAMCCDGLGAILKKDILVDNTPAGAAYLMKCAADICRKHHIEKEHVIIGGEDCGYFASNFIYSLHQAGYALFRMNAHKAKLQRENMKASTDRLDLLGIASVLLNRQGYPVTYADTEHLRMLCRHRHQQVGDCTALSNRIHAIVDQLFPQFLNVSKSGIPAFSPASLALMSERFTPAQIAARRTKTLTEQLHRLGVQEPLIAAEMLKQHAACTLAPIPSRIESLQVVLADQAAQYKCLRESIARSEQRMAQELATMPGAFALTMRGTGVVLAAQLTAELGNINNRLTKQIMSYAGIVPGVKQTGGPDKPARIGGCPRSYNSFLKDTILQLAVHVGRHGPDELFQDFHRRKNNHQNAEFGIARRYARTYLHLVRHETIYLPEPLRKDAEASELAAYYVKLWPALRRKWEKAGALETAFDPANPLGIWRDCVQTLYNIKLPLKGSKTENHCEDFSIC